MSVYKFYDNLSISINEYKHCSIKGFIISIVMPKNISPICLFATSPGHFDDKLIDKWSILIYTSSKASTYLAWYLNGRCIFMKPNQFIRNKLSRALATNHWDIGIIHKSAYEMYFQQI